MVHYENCCVYIKYSLTPQDLLISLLAFVLLISAGSVVIRDAKLFLNPAPNRGLGALQIINSFLYLVDFGFSAMNVVKGEK